MPHTQHAGLLTVANDLIHISDGIDAPAYIKRGFGNPESYPCLYFVLSQAIRLKSVTHLIQHYQDFDAGTVARTMFEGEYLLKWILQSSKRCLLWRDRSIVDKFITLQLHKKLGQTVDPRSEAQILMRFSRRSMSDHSKFSTSALRMPVCKNVK